MNRNIECKIYEADAIEIPFGKRSFMKKVKTSAQTKNIVAIFRFNQKNRLQSKDYNKLLII